MNARKPSGPLGFVVEGISYVRLCNCLAGLPGVIFTSRRRFFFFAADVRAEFNFRGHGFRVEPDPWDSSWWVRPRNEGVDPAELCALRDHVANQSTT